MFQYFQLVNLSQVFDVGCLAFKKVSRKSGRKVNGTQLFGSFSRKISGSNGTSTKVVLFIRTEYSKRKFLLHFFKDFFSVKIKQLRFAYSEAIYLLGVSVSRRSSKRMQLFPFSEFASVSD